MSRLETLIGLGGMRRQKGQMAERAEERLGTDRMYRTDRTEKTEKTEKIERTEWTEK